MRYALALLLLSAPAFADSPEVRAANICYAREVKRVRPAQLDRLKEENTLWKCIARDIDWAAETLRDAPRVDCRAPKMKEIIDCVATKECRPELRAIARHVGNFDDYPEYLDCGAMKPIRARR